MRKLLIFSFLVTFLWACNSETKLSPTNITNAQKDSTLKALFNDYNITDNCIISTNEDINISLSENYLVIPSNEDYRGEEVQLKQIQIKSPSEHTINGKHYPLEIQFVHYPDSSTTPVIASVFVEQGAENIEFAKITDNLPKKGQTSTINSLDVYQLFPQSPEYWFYIGTTTQKPYTPDVKWFIMKTPITASAEQIQKIKDIIGENNIETVQGATVYEY